MTCIVGLVQDDKVYIGGDSLGADENGGTLINAEAKVFRSGAFLIGKSGSMRMGQIMRHVFKLPEYNTHDLDKKDAISCYMATLFVQEMKACFDKLEYKEEEKGALLVGFQGRLFKISADNFQVEEDIGGYNAIGIGHEIAKGSLWTTRGMDMPPESRLELALKACADHNAFVRCPFIIESI